MRYTHGKTAYRAAHLTEMSERIIKSSISVFESFNSIRNSKSLAHDNPHLIQPMRRALSSTVLLHFSCTSRRWTVSRSRTDRGPGGDCPLLER